MQEEREREESKNADVPRYRQIDDDEQGKKGEKRRKGEVSVFSL